MMASISSSDFDFADLDIQALNGLLNNEEDIFTSKNALGSYSCLNEPDLIDQFLNLDQNKSDFGIFVDPQKPASQVCNGDAFRMKSR